MLAARGAFDALGERVWLNCAHQGPLPNVAAAAVQRAVDDKVRPWQIADEDFAAVPLHLKALLGRLIDVPAEQVILADSTSYGLQLLVQHLPWRSGDEILLVDGDFPASIYPWLPLRRHGVTVRLLTPDDGRLTADQVAAHLSPATRLFCASWVFSLTGQAIDLDAIGSLCRERGVWFVANGSQAVGARPLHASRTPIDGLVSCGYKWLCGPYATGFAWFRPELREQLVNPPAYWLTQQPLDQLGQTGFPLRDLGANAYDVFCPANFFNFPAWSAAIEVLLDYGIEAIDAHDQTLVQQLIDGLANSPYSVSSPRLPGDRSTLVFVTHRASDRNAALHAQLRESGIDVAQRSGQLRLSPHLYNLPEDVERTLAALHSLA